MTIAIAGTPVGSGQDATSTLSATLPSGITTGELLWIIVNTTLGTTVTTPAGWTLAGSVADGFGGGREAAFYRIADGTEGATVSISLGSSVAATSMSFRITGQHPTVPIDATATTNSGTSGSTTAITSPSITTVSANCMILRGGGTRGSTGITNPGSNTDVGTTTIGTAPLESTQRVCYAMQAAAGASGTAAFVSAGGDREWQAITIAIAPAPGPTINTQPTAQTGNVGGTATFTIAATTSGGTLHYQWKDDGTNVGTDSNSYTTAALIAGDNGAQITCVVSDDNGNVTSDAASLWVAVTYPVPVGMFDPLLRAECWFDELMA